MALNDYIRYKERERAAFKILFPDISTREMELKELFVIAQEVIPSLHTLQRNAVHEELEESLALRKTYSLRFKYAPLQKQKAHAEWCKFIRRIVRLIAASNEAKDPISQEARNEEVESHIAINLEDDNEQIENSEYANILAGDAIFLQFLEDVEIYITQAQVVWERVKAGETRLSVASMRMCPLQAPRV
jgi:hypothetical protein